MNCVVYPAPSAKCGNSCCPDGGCASSVGCVVVRRKSRRWLYRPRIPTTEIPEGEGVETRSTPCNGFGTFVKPGIWLRNTAVCPLAGTLIEPVKPVEAP